MTKGDDWKAVVDLAFEKFGHLDILVNNAGTTYKNKVCELFGFKNESWLWPKDANIGFNKSLDKLNPIA